MQPIFNLIIFIMIDKRDDYQLVQFIISFKGLQFFTMGCIGGIYAYSAYFFCISFGGKNDLGTEVNKCAVVDDISKYFYYLEVGGFVLQVVLVWTAFLLVPFSV